MSLRVTLAVEDWMDSGNLLKQEVKRDSHFSLSPLPLPQVMDLQSHMRFHQHKGWTLKDYLECYQQALSHNWGQPRVTRGHDRRVC